MINDTPIVRADMQTGTAASFEGQLAMAKALYQGNDPVRAEASLRALHAWEPGREDAAMLLAEVQRSQARLSAASETLFEVCRVNGFEVGLSLRCAEFVRQCDRHAVAERICEGALARGAATPELLMLAGNVAREAGDFETARARYRQALQAGLDLDRHQVFGALANTRRYTDAADSEIVWFAKHFADARYSPRSRASAGFALAKAHDDLGDYEVAAKTLRAANAMVCAVQPWDGGAWSQFVDARLRERVATVASRPRPDFKPVFIVGVPRSGTTLTATLLSRATGARDRGELRALRFIAGQLIGGDHLVNPSALAEAAEVYHRLAVQDDAPAVCYLDQDPLNFRWLHIVAAMFPQARVIHLRRDRRDTALSLWSQDFAHPDLGFASSFDDTAAYMDGHAALMRHWVGALPLPVLELDYESLVAQTAASLAKLGDFIGLPMRNRAAQDESAPVQSASVWQARQPVYATSAGRWKHYVSYVPELLQFGGPD